MKKKEGVLLGTLSVVRFGVHAHSLNSPVTHLWKELRPCFLEQALVIPRPLATVCHLRWPRAKSFQGEIHIGWGLAR